MVKLYEPPDYDESLVYESGGCGPGSGLGDKFVPDAILGLSIRDACLIHDFYYRYMDKSIECKKEADRVFLNNMVRIIVDKGGALKCVRLRIARKYYQVVKYFGGPAFWGM